MVCYNEANADSINRQGTLNELTESFLHVNQIVQNEPTNKNLARMAEIMAGMSKLLYDIIIYDLRWQGGKYE